MKRKKSQAPRGALSGPGRARTVEEAVANGYFHFVRTDLGIVSPTSPRDGVVLARRARVYYYHRYGGAYGPHVTTRAGNTTTTNSLHDSSSTFRNESTPA